MRGECARWRNYCTKSMPRSMLRKLRGGIASEWRSRRSSRRCRWLACANRFNARTSRQKEAPIDYQARAALLRFHLLLQYGSHRRARTRRTLFAPGFQPLARFFDIRKHRRILEGSAPRRHDHAHALPDDPDFAVALKKQFVVNQPAVHDARHHLPVADHHTNIGIFIATLRILLHRFFGRQRPKMLDEPRARLP